MTPKSLVKTCSEELLKLTLHGVKKYIHAGLQCTFGWKIQELGKWWDVSKMYDVFVK